MACNIILTDNNAIRATQFSATAKYNIEEINFYIPVKKARDNQVFIIMKNSKNLYEIVELISLKEGSTSTNMLYKVPLKQALRINNESVSFNLMLINIDTGEYTYSSSFKINICTDTFRMAQQVFTAQQVNRQVQDYYVKTLNLFNKMEELYKNNEEERDKE